MLMLPRGRRALASPRPWLALLLALAVFAPTCGGTGRTTFPPCATPPPSPMSMTASRTAPISANSWSPSSHPLGPCSIGLIWALFSLRTVWRGAAAFQPLLAFASPVVARRCSGGVGRRQRQLGRARLRCRNHPDDCVLDRFRAPNLGNLRSGPQHRAGLADLSLARPHQPRGRRDDALKDPTSVPAAGTSWRAVSRLRCAHIRRQSSSPATGVAGPADLFRPSEGIRELESAGNVIDHYQLTTTLRDKVGRDVLLVSRSPSIDAIAARFASSELVGNVRWTSTATSAARSMSSCCATSRATSSEATGLRRAAPHPCSARRGAREQSLTASCRSPGSSTILAFCDTPRLCSAVTYFSPSR